MLAFAAYKEDDYRSEKDSRKTKGIDRSADSGMWTERPLLSPRLPKKPPTTCSTRETIICTISLSLSHAHTDAHTHTHSINTQVLFCLLSNRSINILTTNTHTHVDTYSQSHSSSFSQLPYPLVALSVPQQVQLFLQARLILLLSRSFSLYLISTLMLSLHMFFFLIHFFCASCTKYTLLKKKKRKGSWFYLLGLHDIRDGCLCSNMLAPLIQTPDNPFLFPFMLQLHPEYKKQC